MERVTKGGDVKTLRQNNTLQFEQLNFEIALI